jgi:hypothetical protein
MLWSSSQVSCRRHSLCFMVWLLVRRNPRNGSWPWCYHSGKMCWSRNHWKYLLLPHSSPWLSRTQIR